MYIVSKSIKLIRKAAAVVLLPLLAWSCQLVTDDYDCENDILDIANKYINITISVSADSNPVTRAPQGGEYGDGSEKGKARENVVNDITLIFYEDATGINTINTSPDNINPSPLYDLTGRKITTPQAGRIYIQNGKKVIMK